MKALFRSWNKTDSQYYYFENGKYYELKEGNKVTVEEYVFNWNNTEQYTEFDDINGNKIFEGDIVETFGKVGSICWDKNFLRYDILFKIENKSWILDCSLSKYITVIGNIHDVK